MKNLLIVSRSTVYQNKSGGLETQLENLISFLKKTFKVTVLTTSLERGVSKDVTRDIDGVNYIFLANTIPGEYGFTTYESLLWQIPFKRNLNSLRSNFQSRAAKYFKNKLQGKFDVIISQSSSAQKFALKNEKLILINHGTTLNEIKNRWVGLNRDKFLKFSKDLIRYFALDLPVLLYEYLINNSILFSKAYKIILISSRLNEDFKVQHGSFIKKTVVIPNWIDTKKFHPEVKNKKFTVVYFGRIDFEKGLNEFIQVSEGLPEIDFNVYGDGPDKEEFIKLIKSPNLKYHGPVSNNEIANILSKSQVFLFLTRRKEGMPMSILEATSSGCVVITTLHDKSMVKLKGYRVLASVNQAIKEIKILYTDRLVLSKISESNREYAVSNFSPLNIAKKYIKVIQE